MTNDYPPRNAEPAIAPQVRAVAATELAEVLPRIGELTVEAVHDNASINFMLPLQDGEVRAYWEGVAVDLRAGRRTLYVAGVDAAIAGCVMLAPASQPNQRHRADIQKLLVARAARGHGVASALMRAAEAAALAGGRWLITLDTRAGSAADLRYRHWGYTALGTVPDYAFDPDGTPGPCTMFYKSLR